MKQVRWFSEEEQGLKTSAAPSTGKARRGAPAAPAGAAKNVVVPVATKNVPTAAPAAVSTVVEPGWTKVGKAAPVAAPVYQSFASTVTCTYCKRIGHHKWISKSDEFRTDISEEILPVVRGECWKFLADAKEQLQRISFDRFQALKGELRKYNLLNLPMFENIRLGKEAYDRLAVSMLFGFARFRADHPNEEILNRDKDFKARIAAEKEEREEKKTIADAKRNKLKKRFRTRKEKESSYVEDIIENGIGIDEDGMITTLAKMGETLGFKKIRLLEIVNWVLPYSSEGELPEEHESRLKEAKEILAKFKPMASYHARVPYKGTSAAKKGGKSIANKDKKVAKKEDAPSEWAIVVGDKNMKYSGGGMLIAQFLQKSEFELLCSENSVDQLFAWEEFNKTEDLGELEDEFVFDSGMAGMTAAAEESLTKVQELSRRAKIIAIREQQRKEAEELLTIGPKADEDEPEDVEAIMEERRKKWLLDETAINKDLEKKPVEEWDEESDDEEFDIGKI